MKNKSLGYGAASFLSAEVGEPGCDKVLRPPL